MQAQVQTPANRKCLCLRPNYAGQTYVQILRSKTPDEIKLTCSGVLSFVTYHFLKKCAPRSLPQKETLLRGMREEFKASHRSNVTPFFHHACEKKRLPTENKKEVQTMKMLERLVLFSLS